MGWNLSRAKSQLGEVLDRVDGGRPQVIRRRDHEYVIVSGEAYRKLTGGSPDFLGHLIDDGPRFDDLETMGGNGALVGNKQAVDERGRYGGAPATCG